MSSYPPTNTFNNVQPALQENPYVQKQPMTQPSMDAQQVPAGSNQEDEQVMRLRGGCPGHFCGLPILPCRCDICIFPIPCC